MKSRRIDFIYLNIMYIMYVYVKGKTKSKLDDNLSSLNIVKYFHEIKLRIQKCITNNKLVLLIKPSTFNYVLLISNIKK